MILSHELKSKNKEIWESLYTADHNQDRLWETPKWVNTCKKKLKKLLPKLKKAKLLDYGCGRGSYFDTYKEVYKNLKIVGADIVDGKAIGIVKGADMRYGIALPDELHECDFDVIVCWSTIHHFDTGLIGRCISGFYDCLNPNGTLIVSGWGAKAKRFQEEKGISPTTGAKSCPIENIKNLLELFFEVSESSFTRNVKPREHKGAFVCYKCTKKKLTLEEERKSRLITYLYDLGADIPFFHLYRFKIDESMSSGEMDRDNSEAYYRDEKYMCEKFGDFVRGLEKACGKNDHYFTKEIYSMKEKQHLFAFHDPGARLKNAKTKQTGMYKLFDFEKKKSCIFSDKPEDNTTVIAKMSVKDLYEKIGKSTEGEGNAKDTKGRSKRGKDAAYKEKFFSGLNQKYPFGVYFFVSAAEEHSGQEIGDGGLAVYTTRRLTEDEILVIDDFFFKWAATLTHQSFKKLIRAKAIRSAIAAIMSRNGSHNIGSHVLAAMSHRLSNQFDNQTLYHYIQDRMAYVAMAATDFPTWRQPTLVYNQLLKGFFAQRQLLRHISESEGFSDFVVVKPEEAHPDPLEKGKIYFVVTGCAPDKDLSVAIPGGVVGNHAFYTILENVIRNAAKHEKPESLVVHIDVKNVKDKLTFSVWTTTKTKITEERRISSTVDVINSKMEEGLLKEDGAIRRGNWGLSEMRISAAFLAGDEKHIIHLDDIVPCVGGDKKNGYGLGYEFSIEKPKELLVVKKDSSKWKVADDASNGIKVISQKDLHDSETAYSYVLFEDKVECKEKLPLRVLETSEIKIANYAELRGAGLLSAVCGAWQKKVVKERLGCKGVRVTVDLKGGDAEIVTSDSDDSERVLFILTDPSFDDLPHRFNAYSETLDWPIDDIDALDEIWHLRSNAVILRAVKEELGGGNKYIANVLAKVLYKAQQLANSNLKCSEDTLRKFLTFLKYVIFAELQTTEASESVSVKGSKTFKIPSGKDEEISEARFIRHGSANKGDYYFESLSGAKNTFSLFRDYVSKKAGAMFEARLVETAALKILVADERVHDYVSRHPETAVALKKMNVEVINKAPSNKNIKNLDIAIIHLGVIDKHLKGNSTQKNVKAYIDRLEKSKRTDVILTTGRGHPDNIPASARVLPYPTVDHTLLQSHPDKMTLLDAVLRVLPGKGGR